MVIKLKKLVKNIQRTFHQTTYRKERLSSNLDFPVPKLCDAYIVYELLHITFAHHHFFYINLLELYVKELEMKAISSYNQLHVRILLYGSVDKY